MNIYMYHRKTSTWNILEGRVSLNKEWSWRKEMFLWNVQWYRLQRNELRLLLHLTSSSSSAELQSSTLDRTYVHHTFLLLLSSTFHQNTIRAVLSKMCYTVWHTVYVLHDHSIQLSWKKGQSGLKCTEVYFSPKYHLKYTEVYFSHKYHLKCTAVYFSPMHHLQSITVYFSPKYQF